MSPRSGEPKALHFFLASIKKPMCYLLTCEITDYTLQGDLNQGGFLQGVAFEIFPSYRLDKKLKVSK